MANVNHQPGMANAATQREFAFRILLQPQRPIDIRATEGCDSFDSPQKPPLSGTHTVIDAGAISRQRIFAWVYGIINELQFFNLHSTHLIPALWGQLFKIIQNHSFFKRWIFSRPRPGPMGFLTFVHDLSEEQKYDVENVLGRAQIIWQEIEADLKDEEPNQFIGEIFQQVFHLWQYKCCMNNMLMYLRGHPRTMESDTLAEFMRYRPPRPVSPYPNHPAPVFPTPAHQPAHPLQNLLGADIGIVGHASIIGNLGNNPTRGATKTQTDARLSTGMSLAAVSLEIIDNQSSGQSDNINPAFNQPYAPMPTTDPNMGSMVSTLMLFGTALSHGLRGANHIVCSAMPNAVQRGVTNTVQAGSSNIPAASVPQSNGSQRNGNAQGNRQPPSEQGTIMVQSRPSQPNLRRQLSTKRPPRTPQVPQFNSAVPGSSATQKRPATDNSNTVPASGSSRPSGKKFKMQKPDPNH